MGDDRPKLVLELPEREAEKLIPLGGKVLKRWPLPTRTEVKFATAEIVGHLVGTDSILLYGSPDFPVLTETAYKYVLPDGRVFYVNWQTDDFPRVEFRSLDEIYEGKDLYELYPEMFSGEQSDSTAGNEPTEDARRTFPFEIEDKD